MYAILTFHYRFLEETWTENTILPSIICTGDLTVAKDPNTSSIRWVLSKKNYILRQRKFSSSRLPKHFIRRRQTFCKASLFAIQSSCLLYSRLQTRAYYSRNQENSVLLLQGKKYVLLAKGWIINFKGLLLLSYLGLVTLSLLKLLRKGLSSDSM